MKIYFLVEGEATELFVYPAWIQLKHPNLPLIKDYDLFSECEDGLYIVSGYGYPNIFGEIKNAVRNINTIGDVDFFVVVVDADEDEVSTRETIIHQSINSVGVNGNTNVEVIVQNRCFETFLLGNKKCIPRNTSNETLLKYFEYYDVLENDPEKMGNFSSDLTHAQFHLKYAITALREKRVRYTKSNCSSVIEETFFQALQQRVSSTPHLNSFRKLNLLLDRF
ncbi:hypothetical protein ABQ366_18760 [Serratia fonticola]|uniref:hypothetical protein n=1 Tax=Serratia fonticola TaxID=47917 RepID=UPI003AAF2A18